MPEAGKATAQLAAEVAHVRKVRPDLPLVAVADAAPDNWTFLEELQPDERAVDFFHATLLRLPTTRSRPTGTTGTELSCATTKGASTRSSGRFAISAARRPALKIPRACVLPQEQRRATRASRPRATRSGVVEAANKVLVNQRMKRAGQRWSIEGGQNVLTFRAVSGRFDAAWWAMTGTHAANENQALEVA